MTEKEDQYFKILREDIDGKFSLVLEGNTVTREVFKEQIDIIKGESALFKPLVQASHDELKSDV